MKVPIEDYLTCTRNVFYIGRGVDCHVLVEAALRLKEIFYIQVEGFVAGGLKHGTIALAEKRTPVIGTVTDIEVAVHIRGSLREVGSHRVGNIVIVSESLAKPQDWLIVLDVHPLLSVLASIVSGQPLVYYTILQRDYDVDKLRSLVKSVAAE